MADNERFYYTDKPDYMLWRYAAGGLPLGHTYEELRSPRRTGLWETPIARLASDESGGGPCLGAQLFIRPLPDDIRR